MYEQYNDVADRVPHNINYEAATIIVSKVLNGDVKRRDIADHLNNCGYKTAKGLDFTDHIISSFLHTNFFPFIKRVARELGWNDTDSNLKLLIHKTRIRKNGKRVSPFFLESPDIIDFIIKSKINGLSYTDIANGLNVAGRKTITSVAFTRDNVYSFVRSNLDLIELRADHLGISNLDVRRAFYHIYKNKVGIQPVLFERTQPPCHQLSPQITQQITQQATKPEPEPKPEPKEGVAMNLNTGDATMPSPITSPTVKVVRLKPGAKLPVYKTAGAVGCDLAACCDEPYIIKAGETVRIGTGIALNLSNTNLYGELHLRSGLTAKYLTLANNVGIIDQDYTGELTVALTNTSRFYGSVIEPGERIAQLVFKEMIRVVLEETSEQVETQRGSGGFGSTGKF